MPIPRRSVPLALAASVLLTAGLALAASVFSYTGQHVTARSREHVLSVITAYKQVCDKGCQYYGPDMVEFVQLPQKRSASSWYTWSHIKTTMKTVKYYSKVDLDRKENGDFVMVTRQLTTSDQATIDELKAATGRDHSPAFDAGTTRFTVTGLPDGRTKVIQAMSMTASGMVAMFGSKIEQGMKDGAAITFKNIEK
jgi:hypothetical protein